MTDKQLGAMTLVELEKLAARFGAAVETIKSAQSLMGGASPPVIMPVLTPAQANPHLTPLTAEEMSAKKRALLPPSILAAEGG